jgi:hypothetical protein
MPALLLAVVLWSAPDSFRVANNATWQAELPAVSGGAQLAFRARADYRTASGSNPFVRIRLNGHEVGLMRDRSTTRLLNKAATFGSSTQPLSWFELGRWRVRMAPTSGAPDDFVLDVTDLLQPGKSNTLVIDHGPSTTAGPMPLVIEHLRLEAAERAPPARAEQARSKKPDWTTPRLGRPSPPEFEAHADDRHVEVTWGGNTVVVATEVRGGPSRWQRRLTTSPTHVEVHDTIANPGGAVIGLHVRHAVETHDEWIHLGGRPEPDVRDMYDPWNPTVFTPTAGGGVGLVAEDDVLRNQLFVDFDAKSSTAGLRTDMLCIGPGQTVELVWSVYPTRTDDYWDFINTVRQDWGVNQTIPGSFMWFMPDDILAMDDAALREALTRQGVGVASLWGGWVDPRRNDRPRLIGFGTYVMSDAFADYRKRIAAAIAKLRKAGPQLRVLVYFDIQRDTSPDAASRYADSLLVGEGGAPERRDQGGQFSPMWGMVATTDDAFGKGVLGVAQSMRELGADGLYWDELSAVDYNHPRVTAGVWDGHTCRLGDDGAVKTKLGLVNLLSEPLEVRIAATGFVLGNGPPTTHRLQQRPDLHMIEAQHNDTWGSFAHLTTPLGYASVQRKDWEFVREKVDEGLLVAGTRLDYSFDLPRRMFPFTPEYIQPGTLRGRERIITDRSGVHGWTDHGGPVRMFRYDDSGKEHEAHWNVTQKDGGVLVQVDLQRGEAAVIERQ